MDVPWAMTVMTSNSSGPVKERTRKVRLMPTPTLEDSCKRNRAARGYVSSSHCCGGYDGVCVLCAEPKAPKTRKEIIGEMVAVSKQHKV